MTPRYADDNAKIDGAIFPLDRKNDKMPEYTGVLEFGSAMLRSMVDEAKAGNLPVKIRIAVWPHQTSPRTGNAYRFVKCEVLYPKDSEAAPESEAKTDEDDDLPWD
jgi:hypothetical protein